MRAYRPSNGTEGMIFQEEFCDQCSKDNPSLETGAGGCEIMFRSMCHDVDDPEYPTEWVYDDNGEPTCTAFSKRSEDEVTN